MHAVLRLIEYDGLRPIDHSGGDLLAAVGRKTMHEQSVGRRERHQLFGDAIGRELVVRMAGGVIGHRHPGIRHHRARALHRGGGIIEDLDLTALPPRPAAP